MLFKWEGKGLTIVGPGESTYLGCAASRLQATIRGVWLVRQVSRGLT